MSEQRVALVRKVYSTKLRGIIAVEPFAVKATARSTAG
jgi:hypothetical protein